MIGLEFSADALSALVAEGDTRADLEPALATLCSKQLIRRAEAGVADEFRFSHILVRDTAYARLLKRTRARLHERFAAWLIDAAQSRLAEYEEILGYHLRAVVPLPRRARARRRRRSSTRCPGVATPRA